MEGSKYRYSNTDKDDITALIGHIDNSLMITLA